MSYTDHLLGYRLYSDEDLATEKATLLSQRTIFIQQAMGTKNFQRDLGLLEERLQAVNFVTKERSATTIIPATLNHNIGVMDFSNLD